MTSGDKEIVSQLGRPREAAPSKLLLNLKSTERLTLGHEKIVTSSVQLLCMSEPLFYQRQQVSPTTKKLTYLSWFCKHQTKWFSIYIENY